MKRYVEKLKLFFLSFVFIFIGVSANAYSYEVWNDISYKDSVSLDKPFTINFNREFKIDEIDGIVVQDILTKEFVPVTVSIPKFSAQDQIRVTPINKYKNDYKYSLRIFLNNGDRYRMNFKTQNQNNLRYVSFYDFQYGRGKYEGDDCFYHNDSFNVRQKEFKEDFIRLGWNCDSTYLLDKKYRRLTGWYGIDDYGTSGQAIIYGDEKELLNKKATRGDKLQYFDIDVSQVDRLKFGGNSNIVFYDLKLGYDRGTNLDLVPQNQE